MSIDLPTARILAFVRENEALIEVVLFVLGFAESLVFLSLFVPASVLFMGIGAIEGTAGGPIVPLVLAGTAGAFVGDIGSYWIGFRYKHAVTQMWPLRNNPNWLPKAAAFIERYGIGGIIVAKFVGPLRPFVPSACGLVGMPWLLFLLASALSSFIWSLVFLAPAYYGLRWATS